MADLLTRARNIVIGHQRGSISLVQRHLKIGYREAAELLEELERQGVVGPIQGNGGRAVLVPFGVPAAAPPEQKGFWQSMDPWLVDFIGDGAALVNELYNEPRDAIDLSRTGDWIQTAIELMKKAHTAGVKEDQRG